MSGWPLARIDECAEIVSGATPSTSQPAYWDGDIHWATPKDLSDLDGAYLSGTPRKITRRGLESCAATVLPSNSVLFSSRAPIGHVAIQYSADGDEPGLQELRPRPRLLGPEVPLSLAQEESSSVGGARERGDLQRGFEGSRFSNRDSASAPAFAAADHGDPGQGGRAAGQAPRRPRPARLPHPIHIPRHVRRPGRKRSGLAGEFCGRRCCRFRNGEEPRC